MKSKLILIPVAIAFQLVLNIAAGAAWIAPRHTLAIPHGITISGEKVGGLTRDQAVLHLEKKYPQSLIDKKIVLEDGQKSWCLQTKDYDFSYDYAKSIDEILVRVQYDKKSVDWIDRLKWQAKNLDMPLEITWNQQKLENFLNGIYQQTYIPPQDACITYQNGQIVIVAEKKGQEMNMEVTVNRIIENIYSKEAVTVDIAKKHLLPHVLGKDLKKIDGDLAVFATKIQDSGINRFDNIFLAAQLVDGAVIMPGQVFSFNRQVGERSISNGFKHAPQIVGGVLRPGVGGGICQVATTLYNAALLAGLQIVERSHHSSPVSYVPVGRDATIFNDQIDLKIKNNLLNPVAVNCTVEKNALLIRILGNNSDNKQIRLVTKDFAKVTPKVSVVNNPDLAEGTVRQIKEGKSGYRVKTYRVTIEDNRKEVSELISNDYYRPVNSIIELGTNRNEELVEK